MISCKVQECCCLTLRCGTALIGLITLLSSAIIIIASCFSTEMEFGVEHILGVPISVIYFFVSSLLIYGVFEVNIKMLKSIFLTYLINLQKSPKCLLPWIIITFLAIITLFIAAIIGFVFIFSEHGFERAFYLIFSPSFILVLSLGLILYGKLFLIKNSIFSIYILFQFYYYIFGLL